MTVKNDNPLPQLAGALFLTDGGIETALIFHEGFDLPCFAAFHLLRDGAGQAALVRYYERYIAIAKAHGTGFVFESPTWRASRDWGERLGYAPGALADINRRSIALMREIAARHAHPAMETVISEVVPENRTGV